MVLTSGLRKGDCSDSGLNLTGWLLCPEHSLGGTVLSWLVLEEKPSPIPAELKGKTQRWFLFCGDDCTHLPWHLKRWEFGQGGSVWESCLSVIVQVEINCLSFVSNNRSSSYLERDLAFPCMAGKASSCHAKTQCRCLAQSVQKLFQKSKMG